MYAPNAHFKSQAVPRQSRNETHSESQHGLKGPDILSHHLFPPRECISRKLEAQLKLNPKQSNTNTPKYILTVVSKHLPLFVLSCYKFFKPWSSPN